MKKLVATSRGWVELDIDQYGLVVRVRGMAKVALHADLTILARWVLALSRARAVSLAA